MAYDYDPFDFVDRKEPSKGLKFDDGKPPVTLVTPDFIEGVADVLLYGAQKYDAWNWAKGIRITRILDAAYRHLNRISAGEVIDPESGRPHAYHVACNMMFAQFMIERMPQYDDRYQYPPKATEKPAGGDPRFHPDDPRLVELRPPVSPAASTESIPVRIGPTITSE